MLQIQQLTDTLNSISSEKDLLLAERATHSFQLEEQISSINQEKDELQKLLQDISSERDQLKMELQKSSEMVGVASHIPKSVITYLLESYLIMYAFIVVYWNKWETGMCSKQTEAERPERYFCSSELTG